MNHLPLKVCGIKFFHNMMKVAQLKPDYMGFIFYQKSPRYMAETLSPEQVRGISKKIKKVGVFVNAGQDEIEKHAKAYRLQLLQLHGQESPELCAALKARGYTIIKVFGMGEEAFDFSQLEPYKPHVDYFLFDTKGKQAGGNGIAFDWSELRKYDQEIPFFLSGGVSMENIEVLKTLTNYHIHAVDVNSQFEVEPGLKDIEKLQQLTQKL